MLGLSCLQHDNALLFFVMDRDLRSVEDFQEGDRARVQVDSQESGDQCGSHHNRRFHGRLGLA